MGDCPTSLQDGGEGEDAASDEADQDLNKELGKAVPHENGEVGETFGPGFVEQKAVILNKEAGKLRRLHPLQYISDGFGAATDVDAEKGEREGLSRFRVASTVALLTLEMPVEMMKHLGGLESPESGRAHHECGQRLYRFRPEQVDDLVRDGGVTKLKLVKSK